ncbi:uncharacterized protein LOC127733463 [Mytilus californianus]|uniref:uncharacterized protein LOC127733463 n=1 Tax=Mytilus californianus TaxID=6549 RepID=UPI0022485760|nr:uncharacterized protein LOC127733463 [Mytilus californianus]
MSLDSILRLLAFLEFSVLVSSAVFSSNEESALDSYINNLIGCKDIPGLGLAVVKDDEVFSKGYGLADIEKQTQTTSSTIFCVGSVTKSMTAMLLARLISSGKYRLRWTTKIKDVLGPDYTFIDDCITDSVTLEDILSHRTGLASADLLLQAGISDSFTREHMMKNLNYLPKLQEFRDSFFYNNIVYILAAHVAEKRANKSWEQLMKEELLVPLNMTSTVILDDGNNETLAVPYIVDKTGKLYKSDERLYRLHPFGPSGSICASADDMTKWLNLITSQGKIAEGSKQIITEYVFNGQFNIKSVLNTMWANAYSLKLPQFPVAFDTLGYGYGWFVSYYRGRCSKVPRQTHGYKSFRNYEDIFINIVILQLLRAFKIPKCTYGKKINTHNTHYSHIIGHRVLHHSGSLYGYSCKITYLADLNSAFVFFTNGPGETKFDETIEPVFFYMLDLILGYPNWINETAACPYPAPWRNRRSKRSTEDVMSISGKELTEMDMHTGVYSHPLYGSVAITRINNTLHIRYGLILTGKLIPTSSSFQLQLFQPLRDVFLSIINVSFQNLSIQNKYQNLEFVSLFEKYTFSRVDGDVSGSNTVHCQLKLVFILIILMQYI